MSTALLASVARPAARSTASKLVDSSIRHTGAAFSLCTRGQHLSHPASPFSLPPFSLYHHQLHAAHGRRAVPLQSPTFSPSCRRGFSQSSKAELDLKVKAYVSTNKTTKPINIGNIKHDNTTRRFYDAVDSSYQSSSSEHPDAPGWALLLSGRRVITPGGHPLLVPSQRLALAVALEWDSQLSFIRHTSMPLTTLVLSAIDRCRPDPAAFIANFYEPDRLIDATLVRVEDPAPLVRLQKKHFDPLLRHLASTHSIDLHPTSDFGDPPHSPTSSRLGRILAQQDEWTLAAVASVASVSRSVVVALAMLEGRLSVEEAFEASRVEENFQMRKHGVVRGAFGHTTDIEYTHLVLAAARTLLNLIHPAVPVALTDDNTLPSTTTQTA